MTDEDLKIRISVDKKDIGFCEWHWRASKITLNGTDIDKVHTVDERSGMIIRFTGEVDKARGISIEETLYGDVEIHGIDHETRAAHLEVINERMTGI